MHRIFTAALLILLELACQFEHSETNRGYVNPVQMTRIGESFTEKVILVRGDNEGNLWTLRIAGLDAVYEKTQTVLEKFDPQGRLLLRQIADPSTLLKTFVVHPSGELTLLEFRKLDELGSYFQIWFKRIASDGKLLVEAPLKDFGSQEERIHYQYDWGPQGLELKNIGTVDSKFDADGILTVWDKDHNAMAPVGEDYYFFGHTIGMKLYRLNRDLEMRWSRQIMPASKILNTLSSESKLGVDENGDAYVATSVYKEDISLWEMHFKKSLKRQTPESTILITQIDENGKFVGAQLLGEKNQLLPAGLSIANNIATIGINFRATKHQLPNRTMEWDLAFLRANIQSGEVLDYKQIDLERDDIAWDFQVDDQGNGYFAGTNDFVQVDTNSYVEFGQAFILKVNHRGDTISYWPIRSMRHTQIFSLFLEPSKIIFGGAYNGPITHTGDRDPSLRFQWGLLGKMER